MIADEASRVAPKDKPTFAQWRSYEKEREFDIGFQQLVVSVYERMKIMLERRHYRSQLHKNSKSLY